MEYVYFIAILFVCLSPNVLRVTVGSKKTILLWYLRSDSKTWPFDDIGTGSSFFVKKNCKHKNCVVDTNRMKHQKEKASSYDAVLFSGSDSAYMSQQYLPSKRSYKQFYVFVTLDPADTKPVCQRHFDNFFNWTMTYRLNSDIPWTHFQIKQYDNTTIGPRVNVPWMHPTEMMEIDQRTQARLNRKIKLAAWFVSDCRSKGGGKNEYVKLLSETLFRLTGQRVDVYGACGDKVCSDTDLKRSNRMLDNDYLFYLAFENYNDPDYVTDKLLTALENFNVPIVLGGADYSRFAPPGSYLNAAKYPAFKLAGVMAFLNKKREKLYDFHKWRNYYYYVDNYDMVSVMCNLCAKLNKNEAPKTYKKFRHWWNPKYETKCRRHKKKTAKKFKKTKQLTTDKPKYVEKTKPEESLFVKAISFVSKPIGYILSSIM